MTYFILVILGCSQSEKQIQEEPVPEQETFTLSIELDRETATAGEDISYEVVLLNSNQEPVEIDDWVLQSSEEASMFWTTDSFRPTVAAEHELTISAVYNEEELVASASVAVSPSSVFIVDLTLAAYTARAGENIAFDTFAEDRYGNAIEDIDIELTRSSQDLLIQNDQLFSILALSFF